ncbi:DUF4435 domain-containing protein [Asticcacaulis sp.]|uniref:DUF4435 domain-containing protein n=1 Tax=Asticcacaulis sp. TaxID=1872648 RepID=UPI002636702F|nr:DUF4435 domain-containing protein [Asticcacaulis sp.]
MSRTQAISDASNSDEALFLRLLQFKGGCGQPFIFLVEGNDDVTFFDACLCRLKPLARERVATYNCNGKGNVLKLHDIISHSKEISLDDFWCFIDKDFDGMRGHVPSEKIWMTPTYSFENLLVSEEVLKSLLVCEFRCNDINAAKDIATIQANFQSFISSYTHHLSFANLCAFYARRKDVETHAHDSTITPAISANFHEVKFSLSDDDVVRRMGKKAPLDKADVNSLAVEFQALDPLADWRGKFLLTAFVAFLEALKHDRGSKAPVIFSTKAKMTFDPRTDSIRTFTSLAVLPKCLTEYLETVPV